MPRHRSSRILLRHLSQLDRDDLRPRCRGRPARPGLRPSPPRPGPPARLPPVPPRPTRPRRCPTARSATPRGREVLPGDVVRREGDDPTGDPAADEAYDGLGATYRLFAEVFGRDSIDGAGLPLLATVHYGTDYDNAFWDGDQMVFGDGDGQVFGRFTASLSVIGHELTHGVTQYTAAPGLPRPVRRAQRVDLRRLRRPGRAARPRADRRRGELADRRGPVHRPGRGPAPCAR